MPPRIPSSQRKPKPVSSTSRMSTLRLDPSPPSSSPLPPAKKQKLKPLSFLSKPPVLDLDDSQLGSSSQEKTIKRKKKHPDKVKAPTRTENVKGVSAPYDGMWVQMYEPATEEDLAVHVRKVQDVRNWLLEAFEGGPSGRLRKYRRILAITGPAGTAKTATVQVLAKEMDFEIMEWGNNVDENHSLNIDWNSQPTSEPSLDVEGLTEKFQTFLTRAASCRPLFPSSTFGGPPTPSQSSIQSGRPFVGSSIRQVILLEDLPNILHPPTQQAFHEALKAVTDSPVPSVAPIVIIVSDAGLRGEAGQEEGTGQWKGKGKDTVDIRSVLPPGMLLSPYVTQIRFNPIAPTLMRRSLQSLVTKHFSTSHGKHGGTQPSKEILDIIVESSNGDIRSAIMALQFACISEQAPSRLKGKNGSRKGVRSHEGRALMEAVTRREQSLALFHLIGKLLYNKRQGDPPAPSASKKDIQRDKDLDAQLKDPPKLPQHLKAHERRASRVDVEALYADSPIDSSLLSLYVHQNYTQHCDEVEECGDITEWLSWIDSNGGETWYQANPHRFHLVSLATLHSLPSPVTRRNQKQFKPEFFDILSKERDGQDGVRDVQEWAQRDENGRSTRWSRDSVTLELGAMLAIKEQSAHPPPRTHRCFSRLNFTRGSSDLAELRDGDDFDNVMEEADTASSSGRNESQQADHVGSSGGWLEEDDIEDEV